MAKEFVDFKKIGQAVIKKKKVDFSSDTSSRWVTTSIY